MRWLGVLSVALILAGCAQVSSETRPLAPSAEARCAEFTLMANDPATTAYRRATAQEALRAQRCPGYQ